MKKFLFILLVLMFASSASAATQPPPIAQNLVREGDFAIKLTESLKIGQAKDEAEAESTLASAGIAPKNGWIADYPVTPDIVGELENTIGMAADSGKLGMTKEEALKAFRTAAVELELPVIAEVPSEYTETLPPTTSEYAEPSVIDNYYDTEGPPVVTYYPPPPDYYYLYAWVPSPFWCSGFFFPGFFVLHDFHRFVHHHGHAYIVTNHFRDRRTGRFSAIDPVRRDMRVSRNRSTPLAGGFHSSEARNGARAIFERSRERTGTTLAPRQRVNNSGNFRNPYRSGLDANSQKQFYNRQTNRTDFSFRGRNNPGAPISSRRMDRPYGMNFRRPTAGNQSFGGGLRGSGPSYRSSMRGGQQVGSPGMGSRGSSGSHQGGGRSGGSGRGHSRF